MTPSVPVSHVLVAFTVMGAGLVNLGMVTGTLPGPQGVLALGAGAVETVVAVLVLRSPSAGGSVTVVRTTVGLLVGASVLGLALSLAPGGRFGAAPAAAAVLQLAAAGATGATNRPRPAEPAPRRRPARALALQFAGAVVVATVTTAGLTDTAAGDRAVPHGEHHLPDLPGLDEHHHGP